MLQLIEDALKTGGIKVKRTEDKDDPDLVVTDKGYASVLNEMAAYKGPDGKPILSRDMQQKLETTIGQDLSASPLARGSLNGAHR